MLEQNSTILRSKLIPTFGIRHKPSVEPIDAATYLKEEIQADALTRNLEGFARFLYTTAASAACFLDVAKLSQEAGVSYQSAKRYFEILEDTLIAYRMDAFSKSARRRLTQHPRYFFFDNGVLNGLLENFIVSDDRKGMLFENLLFTQKFISQLCLMIYRFDYRHIERKVAPKLILLSNLMARHGLSKPSRRVR